MAAVYHDEKIFRSTHEIAIADKLSGGMRFLHLGTGSYSVAYIPTLDHRTNRNRLDKESTPVKLNIGPEAKSAARIDSLLTQMAISDDRSTVHYCCCPSLITRYILNDMVIGITLSIDDDKVTENV